MVLELLPESVYGVPTLFVIGSGLLGLVVLILIIILLGRSREKVEVLERGENEVFTGLEVEEKVAKKRPMEMAGGITSDEKNKYEAKIQQLTNMLNVERDKLKTKDVQFQQQSNEFVKVAALKDEVDYLQKRLGEQENEKSATEKKHNDELKSWEKKYDDTVRAYEAKVRDFTTRTDEEKSVFKADLERQQKESTKKHAEEVEVLRKEVDDLKTQQIAEKRRLEGDYEKRFDEEKRRFESKLEEVKIKAKEAIQRVTREKDDQVNDIREENERLKKEIERLKERIRLLEVEHL